MRPRILLRDERGTTLAELVVGMGMAAVVLLGLTMLIVSTLHSTQRVSLRVEATQNARLVVTRLIDELDSACVMPKVAPVRKESTGSVLRFIHANGAEVTPIPTLSVVALEGTTLTQTDYAWKEGSAPNWVFEETPAQTTQLMTEVSQISPGQPLFSYYAYANGAISPSPQATPLSEADATKTLQVSVALRATPRGGDRGEENAPAPIQDSATFRLTASPYNPEAVSLPCQ